MKKSVLFALAAFTFSYSANSQITKGNWLLAGSATVSQLKSSSTSIAQYNQTNIQMNPTVGYFLKDKFAIGIKPSLTYSSNNAGNNNTIVAIGPFVRYYFLNPENKVNLFAEGSYGYGSSNGKTQSISQRLNTFSFSGGPVVFINSSVGLAFIVLYSTTKIVGFSGSNNQIGFGIGFQIHLEKDK